MSKNQTDKEGFLQAIKNDEYAEFILNEEDPELILITDWEGDHFINPYVIIPDGCTIEEDEIWEMLTDTFSEFGDIHIEIVEQENEFNYAHINTEYRYPDEMDI